MVRRPGGLPPLGPGLAERHSHDHVRHGTTSLFAALDGATGKVIGACYRRHRHPGFLKFLGRIDEAIPEAEGVSIPLILDNDGTHKTPAVKRWLLRHPRYVLHFTPTSGSWLNRGEGFFAALTERRRRGVFRSVAALAAAIKEYLERHNQEPRPFVWTASAEWIFSKLRHTCETNS